jgi:hypothetical protein
MYSRAIIIIIIFLSGLTYAGYHFWQLRAEQDAAQDTSVPLSTALGKEVPLITIEHTEHDDTATLIVENYDTPKVRILSDPVAADRANAYISRYIEDILQRFSDESHRGAQGTATSSAVINTFTLNAQLLLATPRLITIAFTESTMLAQIPHPEKFVRYITFDLMQAKPVETKDMFVGTDSLTRIASKISSLPDAKSLSREQIDKSLLRDDQHAITKDGLRISIDTDEDPTTRTRSSVEVTLPLSDVSEFINKDIQNAIRTEQDNIRMAEPESPNAQ